MIFHKHIEIEKDKRIFIFGDVHGRYDLLTKAHNRLGIKDEDIKIYLGDLTDRGTQNFRCVIAGLRSENAFSIRGNHEDMMILGLLEGDARQYFCWKQNGGQTVLDEMGEEGATVLATILEDAPVMITASHGDKTYGFIHGGYPSVLSDISLFDLEKLCTERDILERVAEALMWDRDMVDCAKEGMKLPLVLGVDKVFHGHTPLPAPLINGNRVYMDTGSCFNGNLTVAVIESESSEIEDKFWFYSTLEED